MSVIGLRRYEKLLPLERWALEVGKQSVCEGSVGGFHCIYGVGRYLEI